MGEARRKRERARLAAIVTPLGDDGHMVYTGTGHSEELFVGIEAGVPPMTPEVASTAPSYGSLEWADGLDDGSDMDPCNYCPHDNTDHRGDGCLHCGCDVPR